MRRRALVAIVTVAAAAVVLFALPLGIAAERIYRDDELTKLERAATSATLEVDLTPGPGDPVDLPGGDVELAFYDRTGRRVAGRGPAHADAAATTVLRTGDVTDSVRADQLAVTVPVSSGERLRGALRAARDRSALDTRVRNARLLLAGLAAAVVMAAAGAAVLLARRLALPLERLAASATRLGHGDFSVRAERSGVAEVDAAGSALDATAARLDELVTRERAFSADAAHQLRTPLAALRLELEAEALERPGEDTAGTRALTQVDRLEQTIEALLAVARDSPRVREPLDVAELLDDLERDWRGPLARVGRPLRTQAASELPTVRADRLVIREVLDVLCDNALRHGAGTVQVRARRAGGGLAIEVEDEGEGLGGDPELAFARRDTSSGGHGIGLALARALAAAEGGRLTLDRPAPRPLFTLLLPGPR